MPQILYYIITGITKADKGLSGADEGLKFMPIAIINFFILAFLAYMYHDACKTFTPSKALFNCLLVSFIFNLLQVLFVQ